MFPQWMLEIIKLVRTKMPGLAPSELMAATTYNIKQIQEFTFTQAVLSNIMYARRVHILRVNVSLLVSINLNISISLGDKIPTESSFCILIATPPLYFIPLYGLHYSWSIKGEDIKSILFCGNNSRIQILYTGISFTLNVFRLPKISRKND